MNTNSRPSLQRSVAAVILALATLGTTAAVADKASAKGSADAAELWIRYLGPASDPAKVRAGTADTLYAAIFDRDDTEGKSCNGTYDKARLQDELDCLSHHFALLEYDFESWTAKDLAELPPLLAKDKAKIVAMSKTALLMVHKYAESEMHEVVIVALVKGKAGKPKVSAVWKAAWSDDGR